MASYSPYHVAVFWSKVEVAGGLQGCWHWKAGKSEKGYGRFKHAGQTKKAHRVAWELMNGEPLGERIARHRCDTPSCCNPWHIEPGTVQDNVDDMMERGRHRAHPAGAMKGERNPRAKLTEPEVKQIRHRISAGETDSAIASDYDVSPSAIYLIRVGRSWV